MLHHAWVVPVVLVAFAAVAAAAEVATRAPAAKDPFPHAFLTNGALKAKVYLPAGEKGYYVASRFEPSGVVACVEVAGHTFFGAWKKRDLATSDHIMGTAEEFCMFEPLGFKEVVTGGVFYRIGVGELVKKEKATKDAKTGKIASAPFVFYANHKIARRGEWKVTCGKDRAEFVQDFRGKRGWGWHYTKRVVLAKAEPSFTISRELTNTGTKAIDTTHYCHNFTKIDDEPIGPAYRVRFPFEIKLIAIQGNAADAVAIRGREAVFVKALGPGKSVWTDLGGFAAGAKDHAVTVENRKTGASVHITGDRTLRHWRFWSTHLATCPEPFVTVKLAPGESMKWSSTYTFRAGKPVAGARR